MVVSDAGCHNVEIENFTFYAESGEYISKNSVCIFVKHTEHYFLC